MHCCTAVLSDPLSLCSLEHLFPAPFLIFSLTMRLPALPFLTTVSPSSDFISFSLLPGPVSSPIWILHPLVGKHQCL